MNKTQQSSVDKAVAYKSKGLDTSLDAVINLLCARG